VYVSALIGRQVTAEDLSPSTRREHPSLAQREMGSTTKVFLLHFHVYACSGRVISVLSCFYSACV
jgi:hypothetical protein